MMNLRTETLNTLKRNTPNSVQLPGLKCTFCGKTAIVVYKGYTLCRNHHFKNLLQERKEAVKNELLNGDYRKALDQNYMGGDFQRKFLRDYVKMFGEDNDY